MSNPTDDRDKAVSDAGECEHCNLTGLTTIFHREYKGLPVEERATVSGRPYRQRLRAVVYCVCPVGRWAKLCNSNDKTTRDLDDVLSGRFPSWQVYDPTTPELPEEIALGNWRDAVAWMIARQPRPVLERIKQVTVQTTPAEPLR